QTMLTNRERFLYGVGRVIQNLCQSGPPGGAGTVARSWFRTTGGVEPPEVHTWATMAFAGLIGGVVPPTLDPSWGNAALYLAPLDAKISELVGTDFDTNWSADQQFAWHWFRDEPVVGDSSPDGEIPPQVIRWVLTIKVMVVVKAAMMAPKPARDPVPA